MTFRTRLLGIFTVAVVVTVSVVSWVVSLTTQKAFERVEDQHIAGLVAQFRMEFQRRGREVSRRIEGIANSDAMLRIALDLNRAEPDYSPYVNEAQSLASALGLDTLELGAGDGTIISSAQWPARFGYKDDWVAEAGELRDQPPFLRSEETAEGATLALEAGRTIAAGEKRLTVIGGQWLDKRFLDSLVMPAGMRVLLYRNDAPAPLAPLVGRVRRERREVAQTVHWGKGAAATEVVHAIPLWGRAENLMAVLMVASSRRELAELVNFIRWTGAGVGMAGILLGMVLSWWASARVTRPVLALAAGARKVAAGNWNARVEVDSADEIGKLARAFNRMTEQLSDQRDRLVQAERVAAWRELARRLAHELKNPLFPLQITVENMKRARELAPQQFDEVFRESTQTLLAELGALKQIIGRFSDFAKMPAPEWRPVNVNQVVREALELFEAQLGASPIQVRVEPAPGLREIQADVEQLTRALRNLVLNAIDAMPQGGLLLIRTTGQEHGVRIAVSDTGEGLTREECERLFTPYYTTKKHGTGLGLAIVQSVVSDHHGRVWVESERGKGTTFTIELPG